MCEVKLAVEAVYGDSTQVMRGKHVLAVARTVDPPLHGTLYCINLAIIIRDILGE